MRLPRHNLPLPADPASAGLRLHPDGGGEGVDGPAADYLRGKLAEGTMILAGPVADPAGPWSLLILRVGSEAEARAVTDGDPVSSSGRSFRYEILPLISAIL
ncbi:MULTISPECIES: YciI family protein [unclassified Mesorhizobium]|uniref:YciI family protein n=1 Tax=unclassified Mesorhizobium TaxID=325217 RepID=UPI001FDA380F|nr:MULTISPECIES: YciI family protein [unclassified Mesorhizobium]WJI76060.1 YciI family protein [Mesorhizobium sp. C395A]